MPVLIRDVCATLEAIAPIRLAEDWDNVGLLVGDADRTARRVMTCLSITHESVGEAISHQADLVITHHPFPFRPLQRMTTTTTVGKLLWNIAGASISIYSPHTAWDSASAGINQQLAQALELMHIRPLVPKDNNSDDLGSGRLGEWPQSLPLSAAIDRVKRFLGIDQLQYVGFADRSVQRVAIGCGSAGSFLPAAHQADCQLLVTGEVNFHTCLEAEGLGINLILAGHFASERFAMDVLAAELRTSFPELHVWASRRETDALHWG